MKDRQLHVLDGHTIVYLTGVGWRCDCPDWEDDGWGCEHTERLSGGPESEALGMAGNVDQVNSMKRIDPAPT